MSNRVHDRPVQHTRQALLAVLGTETKVRADYKRQGVVMKLFILVNSEVVFLEKEISKNASSPRVFGASGNCQHCESVCASGCGANCKDTCGGRGRA
jgi:hypothetical protein